MIMKAVTLLLTITLVQGYANFRNNIPNGGGVPNPCDSGFWSAVGHYSINSGTVAKNQFALDFRVERFRWTRELCIHDSDGDGISNGAELGDPECTWRVGQALLRPASGHPGICEPVDSPTCIQKGFNCRCLANINSCNMPGGPR